MDPLSITLAVITFATAVKDLVELAQAIRDTFAKVPQNYKKAFNLASDILRTSKQIQTLYVSKKYILDSAEDLKECLQDLTQEMLLVRNECVHLIPPVSDKIQERLKISLYFFWNRNRVEDLVSGLKSHVDSCYRNFLLLSSIRTEATVNQISRIVGGIAVQVQSEIVPRLPDAQPLCQFSKSCSPSMERIEHVLSDREIYKRVLCEEVGRIKTLLGRLTSDWHANPLKKRVPPGLNTTWNLHHPPAISDAISHQKLIVDAFQLQSVIDTADIIKIDTVISIFSCGLEELGMSEDALTITLLAVESWKKIISLSPTNDLNAWAHHAHQLTKASAFYSNIGDMDKAYATSQEAIDIIQEKLDCNDVLPGAHELMARNLCMQAKNTCSPPKNKIELATRAVLAMEDALRLHKFQKKPLSVNTQRVFSWTNLYLMARSVLRVFYTRSKLDSSKLDSSSLHDSLYSYSTILLELSDVQETREYINEARTAKKRALVILHSLLLVYPNSERLFTKTASVVLDLCSSTLRDFNSLAENLAYAEEGTDKYRKLLKTNYPTYILRLLDALQSHREIFLSAGMVEESARIIKEMIALSELASQRYEDLESPSEIDGDYQFQLASILYYEDQSSEGINAAHNAVDQYSALAFQDPDRSPRKLIEALTMLCSMLCKTKQYQSAAIEGFRALRLINDSAASVTEIQEFADSIHHISLIDHVMEALAASPLDPGTVERASTLIAQFTKLFFALNKFNFLSRAPQLYMQVLDKHGLVDDAINYGQDFLSTWEKKHTYSNSDCTVYSYLTCMREQIGLLKKLDRTHDALRYTTSAMAQCSQHFYIVHTYQNDIAAIHIRLLCSMGLYEAALGCAQVASVNSCFAQTAKVSLGDAYIPDCAVRQLLDLVMMQLYNYLPLQAIETAGRAELLARSEYFKNHTDNFNSSYISNYSAYMLSAAFFDAARTSESLAHLTEWKDGTQGKVDSDWQSEIIDVYNCHVSAITARIYFVQSDYAQAKQLMAKVVEMDQKFFEEDKSYLVDLTFDLLFAAIAFCCVNEHEAGVASLAELDDLQRRFSESVTHPALARGVEFNLVMQVRRGQWKLIQTAARAKLTCNHVDQALDLNMACLDNTRLEAVESEQ